MPYITREDGERFVIPSYRDVLTANQNNQLKREIILLSQSYGEYITLQKKSPTQYEVAFSTDTGYLLGESIWHYYNKPLDLIYCEAIPNTTEAILVIVKAGSVYLDGSFSLDSIPEELIIFLTQQNNFEIHIFGDVPISQEPEAGKFSFEATSVKSFEILTKPAFSNLPLLKTYQLQLVEKVLKAHGIGPKPLGPILGLIVFAGLLWFAWSYFFTSEPVVVQQAPEQVNPYQTYLDALNSPSPSSDVKLFLQQLDTVTQIPGWVVKEIKYLRGSSTASVVSSGGKVASLYEWAAANQADVVIMKEGIYVKLSSELPKRPAPTTIASIDKIIGVLVDRLSAVYPGNNLTLNDTPTKDVYTDMIVTVALQDVSPMVIDLIGKQLDQLPIVLQNISLIIDSSNMTGSITLEALGK